MRVNSALRLALTRSSSNLLRMVKRFGAWMFLAVAGCGSADDEDSSAATHEGVAGAAASGGAGASHPQVTGGTGSSAGGSHTTGGSHPVGGSSSTSEPTEQGLCAIDVRCTQPIVDDPPVTCSFELRDSTGTIVFADQAGVELRGRSSMSFPKKNYGIELRAADGTEKPTNLLGMGRESDWVLDGAWADRSFMRNRLSFSLFRDMGPKRWAPRARYCELSLNQKYQGIYVLLEKIKRDDDRVDLPDDDGTGATFLVKQDDRGSLRLSIGVGSTWKTIYPNSHVVTDTQTRAVQAWLDRLGAALSKAAPTELAALFDAAGTVDWILLEEFAKNVDAYNLSLFFARSAGGAAWPIPWDLDLTLGQPTIRDASGNESPEGWVQNRTALIARLSAVDSIRTALGPRWRELRKGAFSETAILRRLDEYIAILKPDALAANFKLWPIEQVDFTPYYAPYSFYKVTSYADETTHLRTWIRQRLVWIDANIDSYPSK